MSNILYAEEITWKFYLMECICIPIYALSLYAISISSFNVVSLTILTLIGLGVLVFYFNFKRLRVSVTEEYIEASFGKLFKRVPINSIQNIAVRKYRFRDVLGWGIRVNIDRELMFNILGDNYTGVFIDYMDKKNKPKKFFISAHNPDRIVEIVNAQRTKL